MLLLPHHYEFAETLADLPFFYKEMAGSTSETMNVIQRFGVPEMATDKQLQEYLLGGEFDDQIEFIDAYEEVEINDTWSLSDEWLGSL